jgi:outer membrane protein OmpA-like peptidoglycan-associated protein
MRIGLWGFACVFLSSSFAFADDDLAPRDNALSVGVTAGVFLPDSDVHDFYFVTNQWQPLNSVGPAMGVRVSYEPIRYGALELEGEVIPIGTDTTDRGATLFGWRTHVIGQLPNRFTPFLLGGVGSMSIASANDVLGDDGDFTMHLGAGGKFFITSSMLVRLDARWLFAPKLSTMAVDDDDLASHFLVTSSLSWRFGDGEQVVDRSREDPDKDGVIAARDRCPFDAGVAPDGCPAVADADKDGLLDQDDACPRKAEVVNEFEDEDGCPDQEPDRDKDALSDRTDACPDAAEDVDGFEDKDGCPDGDNDKDGVADADDRCALDSGPTDNGGCPEKDSDKDTVADRFDNCPAEVGTARHNGCTSEQRVVIGLTEIKVLESVHFATGKAKIRSRSNPLLNNLAQVLMAHPEITRVSVEGHTDDHGGAERNRDLSQRRAQAVVDYLASRGVPATRLAAVGHGEDSPIADNGTSSGRARNRRVEFRVERNLAAAP